MSLVCVVPSACHCYHPAVIRVFTFISHLHILKGIILAVQWRYELFFSVTGSEFVAFSIKLSPEVPSIGRYNKKRHWSSFLPAFLLLSSFDNGVLIFIFLK